MSVEDMVLEWEQANPCPPTYVRSAGAQEAVANAVECIRLEEEQRERERAAYHSEEARASRRMYRNMMLAGSSLELLEALCRGEAVPLELLDQRQVRRYGLR